mgnify:CR=1 FL=1|tara:strand:- start:344 stop:1087 length:744 start_codon:yes stop_codon:yes gene_type:complete
MDYQKRIYEQYASVCRSSGGVFNEKEAMRYAAGFSRYFDGWLPPEKNANILDLACGSGRTLYFLKKKGYSNICGVDISEEQVALARQVTNNVTVGNVLEFLTGKQSKYDLIFAQDIVEHLTKNEVFDMLEACQNALAPGGRLILSSPNAESPMFGFRRYGDFTHEICITPSAVSHVLKIVGFDQVTFREIGPYSHGIVSGIRTVLWAILRWFLKLYNLIEIGHPGSGICTRDFLISAVKPSREGGDV